MKMLLSPTPQEFKLFKPSKLFTPCARDQRRCCASRILRSSTPLTPSTSSTPLPSLPSSIPLWNIRHGPPVTRRVSDPSQSAASTSHPPLPAHRAGYPLGGG